MNPAFLLDESAFVQDLLSRLGPIPRYFPQMGPRNAAGPPAADLRSTVRIPAEVAAGRARRGDQVVDVRARQLYARGHLPGSLSVDANGPVATWVGWVTDIERPITIVAESDGQAAHVQRELARIGVDRLAGVHIGPVSGVRLPTATFPEVARKLRSRTSVALVDVRDPGEWRKGHLRGAAHVPAYDVATAGVPDDAYLYCGVGMRATVAGSVLARSGVHCVVIDDQLARAKKSGLPWCTGTDCPDDRCTAALVPARAVRR